MSISTLARRAQRDDGFGLVEAMVALFIALIVVSSTATLLVGTLKATLLSRQNQQAADVLNERVEYVRSLPYASTTMSSGDTTLAGDSNVVQVSGIASYNAGSGYEKLALAPVGAISPHITTLTRNQTDYTIAVYVTCPSESGTTCVGGSGVQDRRVTIVATWLDHGRSRTRKSSTIITETRRGLPLPYFRFGRAQSIAASIGGPIQVPLFVTNLGARDSWDLSAGSGTWTWWWDKDQSGTIDSTNDVQLTGNGAYDVNGNGLPETGVIDSGKTLYLYAIRTATVSDIGTTTVAFTARSVAQPTASSASQTFTDTILTSPDYCPGCTSTKMYFHNALPTKAYTSGSNTSTPNKPLGMDLTAPTATVMGNYSTDLSSSGSGRYLVHLASTDSAGSVTNQNKVAVWQRQIASAGCSIPAGAYAAVTFYGLPVSGFSGAFQVLVGKDSNASLGGFAVAGSQTFVSNSWGTSFGVFTVSIPITTALTFQKNNDSVEVRVVAPGTSVDMRLAYDTTTYASYVSMPLVGTSCV